MHRFVERTQFEREVRGIFEMVKLEFVCVRPVNFRVKRVMLLVFVLSPGSPSFANSIDVHNIEWQPYYYKNHTEISGHAKNFVELVSNKAGVDVNYHLKP